MFGIPLNVVYFYDLQRSCKTLLGHNIKVECFIEFYLLESVVLHSFVKE